MLKHERLTQTVFAVTYENGVIYVNYGNTDYALENGTVIPAESGSFVPTNTER